MQRSHPPRILASATAELLVVARMSSSKGHGSQYVSPPLESNVDRHAVRGIVAQRDLTKVVRSTRWLRPVFKTLVTAVMPIRGDAVQGRLKTDGELRRDVALHCVGSECENEVALMTIESRSEVDF